MSGVIGIIDYGVAGNIHSIKKAIEASGGKVQLVEHVEDLKKVDKIVIPGVGSFRDGMSELKKSGLLDELKKQVLSKPTLGICLGMQIMANLGFEYGRTEGLGVINAEVKPMIVKAKVPHVGFSSIDVMRPNAILEGLHDAQFYFMHSFEFVNYTDVSSLSHYGGHTFVSSISKGHIFGVQFHPEKSRLAGIKLFENFNHL